MECSWQADIASDAWSLVVSVPSLEGKATHGWKGRVKLSLSPATNLKKVFANDVNRQISFAFGTRLTPECGAARDSLAVG